MGTGIYKNKARTGFVLLGEKSKAQWMKSSKQANTTVFRHYSPFSTFHKNQRIGIIWDKVVLLNIMMEREEGGAAN